MKAIFQAILLLGLVIPVFSAVSEVDFDGRNKADRNPVNFLDEATAAPKIVLVSAESSLPEMVRVMERLTETGEFVEIAPEIKLNEAGEKVTTYTVQPGWAVRWRISCPGNGSWSKKIIYAGDTAAGGHNHSNPAPPPLLFSNSQSAQLPPYAEWAYAPSPISFPVMQGYNKPYYYWMGYP